MECTECQEIHKYLVEIEAQWGGDFRGFIKWKQKDKVQKSGERLIYKKICGVGLIAFGIFVQRNFENQKSGSKCRWNLISIQLGFLSLIFT